LREFDLHSLLDALHEAGVDFIVIGGVAVGAHGFIRGTSPQTTWVSFGRGGNVTAMTKFGGLDVVQRAQGVPSYSQLAEDAVASKLLGIPVRVCSLARLRQMKEAQSRTRDQLDLENLPEG
jgi:hypothetical protein